VVDSARFVPSPDCVGWRVTGGADFGVGVTLAGFPVNGFPVPGLVVLAEFAGLSALSGFAFTMTGRGAALIAATRREAERRWALAGVEVRPTPRRIERTTSTRLRLRGNLERVLADGTTGLGTSLGQSGLVTSLVKSGLGTNLVKSGLGTSLVESSTPGSAFDMRQGYARDVTIQ
jgi:hypothetical protein